MSQGVKETIIEKIFVLLHSLHVKAILRSEKG